MTEMVCRRSSGSSLCVFVVVVCIKTVLFAVESHLRLIELIHRHSDAPTFTRLSLQMRPIFSLFAPPPYSPSYEADRLGDGSV